MVLPWDIMRTVGTFAPAGDVEKPGARLCGLGEWWVIVGLCSVKASLGRRRCGQGGQLKVEGSYKIIVNGAITQRKTHYTTVPHGSPWPAMLGSQRH